MIKFDDSFTKAKERLDILGIYDLIMVFVRNIGINKNYLDQLYTFFYVRYEAIGEEFDNILNSVYEEVSKIDKKEISANDFLNLLLLLKGSKFVMANKLLEELHYEERINELFEGISSNVYGNVELSRDELKIVEARLSLGFNDVDLAYEVIKRRLSGFVDISYAAFCNAMIVFIKQEVLKSIKDDKYDVMIFSSYEAGRLGIDNCKGFSTENIIGISESAIRDFYESGNSSVIMIIFHEIRHISQEMEANKNRYFFNVYEMMIIKENIISNYYPMYCRDNYKTISFEVDARIFGMIQYMKFLATYGYFVHEDYEVNEISNERIFNGVISTVDEIFNEVIRNHPEELLRYQKLNYLYKIENGVVVPKSIEEMKIDFEEFMSSASLSFDDKNLLRSCYVSYFDEISKKIL